jgi:hypothetical protein
VGKIVVIAGVLLIGALIGFLLGNKERPAMAGNAVEQHRMTRSSGRAVQSLAHGYGSRRLDDRDLEKLGDLERLALVDPELAQAQLKFFTDSDMRGLALAAIGRGWAGKDPEAAARWIEGLELETDQTDAALGLIPVWAEGQPEQALKWSLARAENSTLRELSLLEVADAWGSNFPRQAMETFFTLPDEPGRERSLHVISTQWALAHPEEAIRFFSELDPADRRDEFLEAALVSLTNENPELSWREAHKVGDPGRVAHIQSQALEAIAESRPQDALRLATTSGDMRLNFLGIARGWSFLNPEEAQIWARNLEEPELRSAALDEIRKSAGVSQAADQEE